MQVRLNTTAVAVFADRVVGLVQGARYIALTPAKLMVATGAREKRSFPGNTLPGVMGRAPSRPWSTATW